MAREGGPAADLRRKERFLTKVYNEMVDALDDDKDVSFDVHEQSVDINEWSKARPTKVKNGITVWTITFTPRGM